MSHPSTLGQATVPKEEQPYGAQQQLAIHLENLLILLARRYKRARKPGVRLRRERRQTDLVDSCPHLLCQKPGAGAAGGRGVRGHRLLPGRNCRQAFRTRLRHTAMEDFSAMRLDYAAQLLAQGDTAPARWPSAWATAAGPTSAKSSRRPPAIPPAPTAACSKACRPAA